MARPIWNGTISFGLLNVPVQLFSGERSVDLHLRLLDSRDKSPIRYERVNADTGEEVPWQDIVKAFEFSKGNYVVIDEKDIKAAAPKVMETVEIEAFVEQDAIDPRLFEKPYYLVPAKKAEKGYVLLREILRKTGKIGVAKVVIRTRQYLCAVLPIEHALVLNLLRYPQEVVALDEFNIPEGKSGDYRISAKEMEMGMQLVESMAAPWNPKEYKDDFRKKLLEIIEKRAAKGGKATLSAVEFEPENESTNVVDFMSLLKKSLGVKGKKPAVRKQPAARKASGGRARKRP